MKRKKNKRNVQIPMRAGELSAHTDLAVCLGGLWVRMSVPERRQGGEPEA
jgi:hypothetical protein